jgi:L-Lysine epsilon oxidase N-terminal/L-lysine epsilon oxidase C-terminal domain
MPPPRVFRVHPTINFARLGTSPEFYLSPETSAGMPLEGTATTGGLPIKAGTESTFVDSGDLRDATGRLKRQAARFRLFAYRFDGADVYPSGDGVEVLPGTVLDDGRRVATVVWTVHLANKKAAAYMVVPSQGLEAFRNGVPQLRNPSVYGDVDAPARLTSLVIDPGPRAIDAVGGTPVSFDKATPAGFSDGSGGIAHASAYPKTFPTGRLFQPAGPLDTLGTLEVDDTGRLLVLPAFGRTAAQYEEYGDPMPLTGDLNNYGWFDDAADGPVSATVVFEDGAVEEAFGAWVVCADPAYAPQIRNVVSVWDDVYDVWVRELALQPEIYDGPTQSFNLDYRPDFETKVKPVFRAAAMQRWTANLPPLAVAAHDAVDAITDTDDPDRTIMAGLTYIRVPGGRENDVGVPLMPLSVGDAGQPFLAVSPSQYFFLRQWSAGLFVPGAGPALGRGEVLDMASLSNCLGGRYVPGIELSYPVRQPDIYITDWRSSGSGPFRVKHKPLHYASAHGRGPFLSGGWIPLDGRTDGLEPGDLSKFMSVPWQTDYNSCSIHPTSINTAGENEATGNPTTLYWSWPAQRPDAVYVADEVVAEVLPKQRWSVRGPGTHAFNFASASTYQKAFQAVAQWDRIGIVIQGSAIEGGAIPSGYYLEVQSQLDEAGVVDDPVPEWPFNANPPSP